MSLLKRFQPLILLLGSLPLSTTSAQAAPPPQAPASPAPAAEPEHLRQRADSLIRRLLEPARLSNSAPTLHTPKRIRLKPGQPWTTGLPDIWEVRFDVAGAGGGHLFMSANEEMTLEEFALDVSKPVPPLHGDWVPGVPNLQQFPIPSPSGKGLTASGCVPTAGSSLVGFWAARAYPGWLSAPKPSGEAPSGESFSAAAEKEALQAATLRLRKKMQMAEIPDKEGYAEGTMSLSGAFPEELANALRKDAGERKVPVRVQVSPFSVETLRAEIRAGRPALASCVVRLPHKPELAWGHEMVAVGCQQVEDFDYVGVVDNFYPARHAATVRWIEKGAFSSLITVRPEEKRGLPADQKTTP